MLSGFENSIIKDSIRYLDYQMVDIHHEISGVNDNIASISEILTRLNGTYVKDAIKELGFQINN
jgi:N-methylhydantoinase B/oxoprolinase/acetone carboxylase alpha subunit